MGTPGRKGGLRGGVNRGGLEDITGTMGAMKPPLRNKKGQPSDHLLGKLQGGRICVRQETMWGAQAEKAIDGVRFQCSGADALKGNEGVVCSGPKIGGQVRIRGEGFKGKKF